MYKKQNHKARIIAMTSILTTLLAGCGGADKASPAAQAPMLAATIKAVTQARWMNVKYGGGGYVPGLIYHPTSPNVLYARTDVGGAYRWDTATASWLPITDGMDVTDDFYHGSESIALDPNDDQRVYMSAGKYVSDKSDGRLYISTNRGDSWTFVNLPFSTGSNSPGRAIGERLMVDPNNPTILFYGTRTQGLWKSADRGQTWQQVSSLASAKMTQDQINAYPNSGVVGVEQVIFDTSTKGTGSATQTIYTAVAKDYAAAAGLTSGLYKTTDGGATWTAIATPADVAGMYIPHMVRNTDGMMYVAFTNEVGPGAGGSCRLYKFDGTNWTLLKKYDSQPAINVNFGMGGLSVSGTGATTRIALGVTNSWGNWDGQPVVQLSDDAGATWREISAMAPHTDNESASGWPDDVEIDPNNREHIMHVTGGGVWETMNASAAKPSWTKKVDGIEETATLSLTAAPPGASYRLLNSSGDIGMKVYAELNKTPTLGTGSLLGNSSSSDMAWSDPSYIAAIGTTMWNHPGVAGAYSTDSGVTWTPFAGHHPQGLTNQGDTSNIAVTKPGNIIWSPNNSVPAYSTDNGTTWTMTDLPAVDPTPWIGRGYKVVADRKNPNKVYAYNPGGQWWAKGSETQHFFTSTDGGHTFTESAAFKVATSDYVTDIPNVSVAVNPNAEGDIWVADGRAVLHSLDGGATWTKLSTFTPFWGANATWSWPEIWGASSIALGKAPLGSTKYSASVYVVGVVNGVWGVYASDDGGVTWRRFNDDKHQYGGVGQLAADQTVPGRLYMAGSGRGVLFSY
jgi:xyloglucan-specific exo-beta-1,4-glucanase